MTQADLHIHSNCSDGSETIAELYKKIKNSGLGVFALTDHDTIEGCHEMSKLVDTSQRFIPGVELTCEAGEIKCHILGYNCDYNNPTLLKLIEKGKELRRRKLEIRINYLKETWGIELTKEELEWLYSRKSVVKTHIANVLVKRGLAENNLLAMQKYLDGCKSGDTRFSGEEAIEAIIASGGIPVWAHPLGGEGEKHISEEEFLPKLEKMIGFGIKGLECYYSRYTLKESELLAKLARKNELVISGGSDYHGNNKNNIKIGSLNSEGKKISSETLTILNLL